MKKFATTLGFLLFFNLVSIPSSGALDVPGSVSAAGNRGGTYLTGTVTVQWSTVTGATHYAVQTLLSGTPIGDPTSIVGQASNQVVVSGLQGGTEYTFRVRANADGVLSSWSTAVAATPITEPAPAPKPTHTNNKLSVTVRWTEPASDGGSAITSYVVTEANSGTSKSVTPTTFSAQFDDLTAGSDVKFNIRSINDINTTGSVSSNSTESTLPNVPAQVSGVSVNETTQKDEVAVTWSAPAARGSAIQSYTVYLRQSGRDIQTKEISDTTSSSHVFSGLSAGQYSAQVLATNAIGAGTRSNESTSITIAGVTPASTTPASGGGGGGGGTPTPTPTPTPTASATPTASPSATPSPTAKATTNPVTTTPSTKIVPGKPTAVAITISKSVNLKLAKSKVISSNGTAISKAIIKISKDNKISVTLPKGTKPGKYTIEIKAKNGKTYKATIIVAKK
jgi:methionine-rich copper-binding protein CopC